MTVKLWQVVEEAEAEAIAAALQRTEGNVSQAARDLGTTHRTLWRKIEKLGLDPNRWREQDDSH